MIELRKICAIIINTQHIEIKIIWIWGRFESESQSEVGGNVQFSTT